MKKIISLFALLTMFFCSNILAQTPPPYDPTVRVEWTMPIDGEDAVGYHLRWAIYDEGTGGPLDNNWTILLDDESPLLIAAQVSNPQYHEFQIDWDWFTPYIVQVRGVSELGLEGSWSISSDPFIAAGSPPGVPGKPVITLLPNP